jgi:MFS family permease
MLGLSSGPAFGMLAGSVLMSRFGRRSFFVVLGAVSLLWLAPWLRWMPRGSGIAVSQSSGSSPSTWEILTQRSAWGSFCALFCVNYTLYLLITWLPFYLVRDRHFSMDTMGEIGSAVFVTQALTAVVCGRYADGWLARGGTSTQVRKTFLIVGAIAPGMCLWASTFFSPVWCIALLFLAGAGVGASGSNLWATTQVLAGAHASGRWTGLQCGFGNYSGVLAATVTGILVGRTGHFSEAFAVAMGFGFLGALCWAFFVGKVEPVVWGTPSVAVSETVGEAIA